MILPTFRGNPKAATHMGQRNLTLHLSFSQKQAKTAMKMIKSYQNVWLIIKHIFSRVKNLKGVIYNSLFSFTLLSLFRFPSWHLSILSICLSSIHACIHPSISHLSIQLSLHQYGVKCLFCAAFFIIMLIWNK